jgi:NitT/TauT family transport system substrate-binding protein
VFLAAIAANVGLDPVKDIRWIIPDPSVKPIELFVDGKIDAFLGFPPEPQELRGIGHVIVNRSVDRPWSQYFCCMLACNREFVRKHPVATETRVAGDPEGDRPLRHPAGARRAPDRRARLHASL